LRKARRGLIGPRSGALLRGGLGEILGNLAAAAQLARRMNLKHCPLSLAHRASQSCPARPPPATPTGPPAPVGRATAALARAIPLAPVGSCLGLAPQVPAHQAHRTRRTGLLDGQPGVCSVCQGQPLSTDAHMGWLLSKVLGNQVRHRLMAKAPSATESRQSGTRPLEPCC